MTFRPYYPYLKVRCDENDEKKVVTELEKCYVDDPDSWSEEARAAIELQLAKEKNDQENL